MNGRRGEKNGTAFVTETYDDDDVSRLTGRFSVHWEADAGQQWKNGPEEVSVDEAVEWGRRHADVVQVLLGGEDVPFSAGARQPEGESLPVWPAGRIALRPRPIGSARDGSEQEVRWRVRSHADVVLTEDALKRLEEHVEADAAVLDVVSVTRSAAAVVLDYVVKAGSLKEAVLTGDRLVREGSRLALGEDAPARISAETSGWPEE